MYNLPNFIALRTLVHYPMISSAPFDYACTLVRAPAAPLNPSNTQRAPELLINTIHFFRIACFYTGIKTSFVKN